MNKLIIVESGDCLGKTSLIKGLCEHFDYKNVTVRHCDKPPKDLNEDVLMYQLKAFKQEFNLIFSTQTMDKKYLYHDNIIIYDRFYSGEYVYGQLFRNYTSSVLKKKISDLEKVFLTWLEPYCDTYLVTLTADPQFFLDRDDGNSFSKNLEQKTQELELFKEAHIFSTIKNKLLVKVDKTVITSDGSIEFLHTHGIKNVNKETNIFREKQEILSDVINFIK